MKSKRHYLLLIITGLAVSSCMMEDIATFEEQSETWKAKFDVVVTRDGKVLSKADVQNGVFDVNDKDAALDPNLSFGVIGVDAESYSLIIDNKEVSDHNGQRDFSFDAHGWSGKGRNLLLSAYYPYVTNVNMLDGNRSYIIPYKIEDTQAGPLVSETAEYRLSYMDAIPLVFRHITNDIGYRICDVSNDDALKGHIRLKKLIAHNVATEGLFVDTIGTGGGAWKCQQFYRDIVIFDGDCKVGVGTENEMFVGANDLVTDRKLSKRYYSIPVEIVQNKQYVEVVFDVEEFTHDGVCYTALHDQVQKFPIYGVLPDNRYEYGKQYTFHLGLDLSPIFPTIEFSASVGDWEGTYAAGVGTGWESKIYEDNNFF